MVRAIRRLCTSKLSKVWHRRRLTDEVLHSRTAQTLSTIMQYQIYPNCTRCWRTLHDRQNASRPSICFKIIGATCDNSKSDGVELEVVFYRFSSLFSNPKTRPTIPFGLGTGHSCAFLIIASVSVTSSSEISELSTRRLTLLRRPSFIDPESAKSVRGAGQGKI